MTLRMSKILLGHFYAFTIIGYCTITLKNNFKHNSKIERFLVLWSWLLLICFNLLAFFAIFSDEEILFRGDCFGYFNDILKVVFADIAVTCAYLETIFKRKTIKEFWKIYNDLQKKSADETRFFDLKALWQNGRFLVIFYSIIAFEFVMMLIFIVFQSKSRHLILFWSVFSPFTYVVYLRNMQCIFYIELIRLELVKLQQDLSLMVDYSRFVAYGCGFKGFEEFLRKKLVDKQKNYQMIYEMFECFQNGFGISIIAVLSMTYVRVLVDSYFAYYSFYNNWHKYEVALLIPSFFEIPAFLITSKNCMDVVKLITFNLHSIISQFNNTNSVISAQLQNFSLQILHQRICINGVGITRMDGYMLTRVIGSITTYMIFFIQFMPKFTNFQDDTKN